MPSRAAPPSRPDLRASGFHGASWVAVTLLSACMRRAAAAPVPRHGGGEQLRDRGPPRRLAVPGLPRAHQPVRGADRRSPACFMLPPARCRRRHVRAGAAVVPGAAGQSPSCAFVGGLSAATAMVIVDSVALSIMVCNGLDPAAAAASARRSLARRPQGHDAACSCSSARRRAILVIVLLGYGFYRAAGPAARPRLHRPRLVRRHRPVRAGLLRRTGVAARRPRAAPSPASVIGFAVWAYTLLLPWRASRLVGSREHPHRRARSASASCRRGRCSYLNSSPLTRGVLWSHHGQHRSPS